MKKIIIAENEKMKILKLCERRNSLVELKNIIDGNSYDENIKSSIIKDLDENEVSIQLCWNEIFEKHKVKAIENKIFYLDFRNNCIYDEE